MNRHDHSLPRSFANAIMGVARALKSERNLRIHFAVGGYLFWFSRYYPLTRAELALLILTVCFVVSAELLNTAVEQTVDIEEPDFNPLARIAKDVAAGAVLVASLGSVAVGYLLFWDVAVLRVIVAEIAAAPLPWLLALTLTFLFVKSSQRKRCGGKKDRGLRPEK